MDEKDLKDDDVSWEWAWKEFIQAIDVFVNTPLPEGASDAERRLQADIKVHYNNYLTAAKLEEEQERG